MADLRNAVEQNLADLDDSKREEYKGKLKDTCLGIFDAAFGLTPTPSPVHSPVGFPVDSPGASPAVAPTSNPVAAVKSEQAKIAVEAMKLIDTLYRGLLDASDDDKIEFEETIGEVSVLAKTVIPDPESTVTKVSIPNSKAEIGIPTALGDCVLVATQMSSKLSELFDETKECHAYNRRHKRKKPCERVTRVINVKVKPRMRPGQSRSRSSKRQLQEDDFSELTECSPFFITIPLEKSMSFSQYEDGDNVIANNHSLPVCEWWDTENSTWSDTGCWVSSFTNDSISCACTHLTSFSGSVEDFIPSANVEALWEWRSLSVDNMKEHPTVFLSILGVLCLFISICVSTRDGHNKPLLAFEDSIFESFRNSKILAVRHASLELKEIEHLETILPTNSKMMIGMGIRKVCNGAIYEMLKLHTSMFFLYLKNEHTLISAFQRSAGTNYTTRQRMSCFFTYLCTLMAISAIFYGVKQQGLSILTASAIMSLVAVVPTKAIKRLFTKSRPKVVESRRINQMLFHLKPNLHALEEERSAVYQEAIDMLSDKKSILKMETLLRSQEEQGPIDGVDWNRLTLVNQIRNRLLQEAYPYPHSMKKIAWILLSLWCLAMSVIALHYGIQFDLLYEMVDQKYVPSCWENNFKEKLNNRFTEIYIENKQNSVATEYGLDYITDSRAWLISLCESLVFSIFLWQPIGIWLMTWLKLWAFTHNLKLDSGFTTMCRVAAIVVCKCQRRGNQEEEEDRDTERFEQMEKDQHPLVDGEENEIGSRQMVRTFRITDNVERPLDVHQFYGSRELLVNDVDNDLYDQTGGSLSAKEHDQRGTEKQQLLNVALEEVSNGGITEEKRDDIGNINTLPREQEDVVLMVAKPVFMPLEGEGQK